MKYVIEYLPPFNSDWLTDSDRREWAVTAMVIYRYKRSEDDCSLSNGCYQMFWPENPWHEYAKNLPVDFKN